MKVLVDTHALVWALSDPNSLSAEARKVLDESEVFASAAALWELILKAGKKDCLLADPLLWWKKYVSGTGIATLPIRVNHVITLGRLPGIHRDPFDRIMIAQALTEKMPLVSRDSQLQHYGLPVIW